MSEAGAFETVNCNPEATGLTNTNDAANKLSSTPDTNSATKLQWNTVQLVFVCLIVSLVSIMISNIDRIINLFNDKSDSISSQQVMNITTNEIETNGYNKAYKPYYDYSVSFGHEMYNYFYLDKQYLYFNWGPRGGSPIEVYDFVQSLYLEIAKCPLCWYQIHHLNEQNKILQSISQYLGIGDWRDLVFVENTSEGINAVLWSLSEVLYNQKCSNNTAICKVLIFTTSHKVVQNTLDYINNNMASQTSQVIVFNVTYPMLSNITLLLSELRQFIESYKDEIYLSVISHIVSFPSTIYDIKSINKLLKEYDIITCFDGAHVMGQINLNITDINPDIYITNGYKWFYSVRGSALMYVNKQFQSMIHPTVISNKNSYNQISSFQKKFSWVGLKDYVPFISFKAALKFRQKFGDQKMKNYQHTLAVKGGKLVAKIWNITSNNDGNLYVDEEYIASMVSVEMPYQNITSWPTNIIGEKRKLWVGIAKDIYGQWVARFSTQIFHQLCDFKKAANIILDVIDQIKRNQI